MSTDPADRSFQVLARLVDVAGAAAGSEDFVASTRAEYPDVFADLDEHLRRVHGTDRDPSTPPPPRGTAKEQAWFAELVDLGIRIAHPDDGWVDREANTINFVYPMMQHAPPSPGVLVALGTPDRWRTVMLTRAVAQPVGWPLWAFVEQGGRGHSRDPGRAGDVVKGADRIAEAVVNTATKITEPITFSLIEEGARVLDLALLWSAEISEVTGWGQTKHYTIGVDHGGGPDASGDSTPHTLADLRRRLEAQPTSALLVVPASLDPSVIDAHFPRFYDGKPYTYPNGSTLQILRGRPEPRQIASMTLDVALVLTAVPSETLDEIRHRVLASGGSVFAPFAVEP